MIAFPLDGAGISLEPPVHTDIDAITEYCTDPLFERWMATPWPYTRTHAEQFVGFVSPAGWHSGFELTWAIRHAPGAPLLGLIGLRDRTDGAMDLGFWVGAPHRGQGLVTRATNTVTAWALDPELGNRAAVLWEARVGNTASARVARALGFRYEGIAPGHIVGRDGAPHPSWHARKLAADDGSPAHDWPVLE
ncbi:MAG: GNAT family N-acetyltransferase [Microbacteriaceae bacterium]